MQETSVNMSLEQAQQVLGVPAEASEADVRAAYLREVREHSPDRDPEQFERIRDAYELLRDPRRRAEQALEGPDPSLPLVDLLGERASSRPFAGPDAWLAVLREKRK